MKTQLTQTFDLDSVYLPQEEQGEEDDLWFLPGPQEEDPEEAYFSPLTLMPQQKLPLVAPQNWEEAQGALAGDLARLSLKLGVLDERLRIAPEGWTHRLAIIEASELSWVAGMRIPPDKLALWMALRLGAQEESGSLARASWAARRLMSGPDPIATDYEKMAAFLGRHRQDATGVAGGINDSLVSHCPAGVYSSFVHAVAAQDSAAVLRDELLTWCELVGSGDLHPITRAAYGLTLWGMAHSHGSRLASDFEAAVSAARLARQGCSGGVVFLPLAMGGAGALRRSGSAQERLAQFCQGALKSISFALSHLARVARWAERAEEFKARRSGKTPGQLITLFIAWPYLSVPIAKRLCTASEQSIHRNLADLYKTGLIRELTGQTRYRFWAADV